MPVDFTDRSRHALRHAATLATASTEIILLHVIDPAVLTRSAPLADAPVDRSIVTDCALHLRQLRDASLASWIRSRILVRQGAAHAEILRAAAEVAPDLLVLSVDALDDVTEPASARTARAVIQGAACPVVTVHA